MRTEQVCIEESLDVMRALGFRRDHVSEINRAFDMKQASGDVKEVGIACERMRSRDTKSTGGALEGDVDINSEERL